jgi:glyoxylase-like metal-dependent hydrolase (beta-lactamase superfamily II)
MARALIHEIIPVGWLQCNCSIVGDPETRECIVVDPGDEVERILEIVARHGLKVQAIVNTHAHIDHVGGLHKLREVTGAPVQMHAQDLELYRRLDIQATMIGMPLPPITEVDRLLRNGDAVRWGRYAVQVMHTPGHTRGSICLHLPSERTAATEADTSAGILFAGDTLFAGSIGRTDLWGGSFEEILRSLHGKLLALPDDTIVYPGHGPATTIGRERGTNPFLQLR